ncbi:MAG: OadG family protein [Desulfobulbaceae bacterium]|nr:OadG family protein [Desulfobulbaceae bacterium]
MGFSFDHISFNNLFTDGHNYITFSIMGMLIVFAGLAFISLYIILLPKILNLPALLKTVKTATELTATKDSETLLAIAVALHLEQTGGRNYAKITWKRHEDSVSSWLTAGRMRGLAVRSHLPDRRN